MSDHQSNHVKSHQFKWLFEKRLPSSQKQGGDLYKAYYGDITELNTCRLIMDSVGKDTLRQIAEDAIDLLETSVAIYELNGDYALGMFSSGWCRLMDSASRKLCQTDDNRIALDCGCWLCHENCWNDSAKPAIESGVRTDIQCVGGIYLYAEPIYAGESIVGSINIGYGIPPTDTKRLKELAETFDVDFTVIKEQAQSYEPRPQFFVDLAKKRLKSSAKIIGEIVEKSLLQKELRDKDIRFRQMFEHISSGVAVYEAVDEGDDFVIKAFNRAAESTTKISRDEALGNRLLSLFPNMDASGLLDALQRVWKTGQEVHLPPFFYRDEIREGWRENYIYKLPTGEIVTLFDDVTDKIQAENKLREKTQLLELITDNMFDMVSLADLEGNYTFAVKSHEQTLGYKISELIGKNVMAFVHPDDLLRINEEFEDFLKTGGLKKVHYRYKHKKGHYLWFETVGKLLLNENQAPDQIIFSTRDITYLQEAKEELEMIFSMSLDMIGIADINSSTFLKINQAFIEKLGFSEEELLKKPFTEFIHPEDIDSTISVVEKELQAGKKVINFNNRYRCKDGSYRWLSWASHPNPKKGITYAVARDITQAKQNEEELRRSKALLEATGRMAKVGGWELDVETLEVTWTDETYRIHEIPTGYNSQLHEAINFFHSEDRPQLEKAIQRALDHGEPYDLELRFITAKGKHLWTRTKCEPEIVDGKVIKLKGTFQDITELKVAEKRLIELKRRNQALLDHSPVCHKIVDLDFNLQYMNASGFKMLKLDDNVRVYGRPYPFAFFPSTFQNEMTENLRKVKDTGKTIALEALAKDIEGNDVWLDSSLIPVFDGNNGLEFITVVSADTTPRKKNEKERERLETQLRHAQKMEAVGKLAGGVAHDFNNMLSVILGNAELALEEVDPIMPLHNHLYEIQKAGQRSTNVVRQLLAFARKQTISPKVLDLNDTIEDMLKMLRRLIGEDIDLSWQPGHGIWPVKMDPSQIDQILANLSVNARDAIPGVGKLTIETGKTSFDETYCSEHQGFVPGEFVLLAVSDNGCGMDAETQKNLFEPFFTTKEVGKGTGLGLATVYGIVKQNNGFINVYSEPNQGTTFKIYLPRHRTVNTPARVEDLETSDIFGNETILLVEDEITILKMTRMMLERLGYTVLTAATPGEAMDEAREHSEEINLLMTDVVMPQMNGRDLAGKLLSLYPDLKWLFMSGYTANVIAHHGILDEGVSFIQKPFSKQDLAAKVRQVLDEEN